MVERLQRYVVVDHKARWKNDLISMAIATVWYLLSLASGVEAAHAFKVSMGILAAATVFFTLLYVVWPQETPPTVGREISKRVLLPQLALACLVLVAVRFGTPAAEAAIVDARLRKALQGEPTKEKIEDAAKIVSQAREHNVNASPPLISQLGAEVLGSITKTGLEETALSAASLFASYRSNLSPPPQVQYQESSIAPGAVSDKNRIYGSIGAVPLLAQSLKKIEGIEEAYLYGSFARNQQDGASNIDVLVIGNPKGDTLAVAMQKLERQLGREINYTVLTRRELKSRRGRKDAFVENVWHNKRVSLVGAASRDSRRIK
jgi:predicted nucleotidyltransferase